MEESPQADARKPVLSFRVVLGALAVTVTATLVCEAMLPEPGEPLWLRWLRVFADHPVRGFLAAALLLLALGRACDPQGPPRS